MMVRAPDVYQTVESAVELVLMVGVFRDGQVLAEKLQVTRGQGGSHQVDLRRVEGVVHIELTADVRAACREKIRKCIAKSGRASVHNTDGSGRVGADKLDQGALTRAGS